MTKTAAASAIDECLARLERYPDLPTIALGLERMQPLLAALGNPQGSLPPVIHIAGTNGKGSLVAYLRSMFRAAGLTAHAYISPHLVHFNERIVLAGNEIDDETLLSVLKRVEAQLPDYPATFFEATTIAAFLAFAETPAAVTLLEVGLGGRLDATNVVKTPVLTAITPVSFDHMARLGHTLSEIAYEKAGILKPGVPCVVGPQEPEALTVIERLAAEIGSPLFRHGREWGFEILSSGEGEYRSQSHHVVFPAPSLAGRHQYANAATAIACAEQLKDFPLFPAAAVRGVASAIHPGRLQWLKDGPLVELLPDGVELWLDGAHNPAGALALAEQAEEWGRERDIYLICGMREDKDHNDFLRPFAGKIKGLAAIAIPGDSASKLPQTILAAAAKFGIPAWLFSSPEEAVNGIVKKNTSPPHNPYGIFLTGSLYLVGEVLKNHH